MESKGCIIKIFSNLPRDLSRSYIVYLHAGNADVCRNGEVGQPQVLDLNVAKDLLYQTVETEPGK